VEVVVELLLLEQMVVINQAQVVMVEDYLQLLVLTVLLVVHTDIMLEAVVVEVQVIDLKLVQQELVEKVVVPLEAQVKMMLLLLLQQIQEAVAEVLVTDILQAQL
jgi:hypothetical protein